jgi:hypothetical protein
MRPSVRTSIEEKEIGTQITFLFIFLSYSLSKRKEMGKREENESPSRDFATFSSSFVFLSFLFSFWKREEREN